MNCLLSCWFVPTLWHKRKVGNSKISPKCSLWSVLDIALLNSWNWTPRVPQTKVRRSWENFRPPGGSCGHLALLQSLESYLCNWEVVAPCSASQAPTVVTGQQPIRPPTRWHLGRPAEAENLGLRLVISPYFIGCLQGCPDHTITVGGLLDGH